MLDYQMIMVAREVSQERVRGLATDAEQGCSTLTDFLQGSRHKVQAFLAQSVKKPVNMVIGQRYQNRHNLLKGIT